MIPRLSTAAAILLLSACASAPKIAGPMSAVKTGRWETKMRIREVAKNKSHNLSVDVIGERAGSLRLEATALLGYPVASYVMNAREFKCAVYPRKVFYEGAVSAEALKPLLGMPLSPVILRQIAFDEALAGWQCTKTPAGEPDVCRSADLTAKWTRTAGRRSVRLEGRGYELDWAFGDTQTDVQIKQKTFDLDAPGGFRVIRL